MLFVVFVLLYYVVGRLRVVVCHYDLLLRILVFDDLVLEFIPDLLI